MKTDLLGFLGKYEIGHPTRVERLNFENSSCAIHLIGRGWWLDEPGDREDVRIEFRFDGIEDARISEEWFLSDDYDEALQNFSVAPMRQQEWAAGDAVRVFCSQPLRDPLSIVGVLDDYLMRSGCPYEIAQFLHMGDHRSFRQFFEMVRKENYLLLSGNASVSRPVLRELERQGVEHSTITEQTEEDSRLLVIWGCGYLICRSALAIYDA